jgi:NADPH:quinone reductase-like Zn-dependent oxidoreductase
MGTAIKSFLNLQSLHNYLHDALSNTSSKYLLCPNTHHTKLYTHLAMAEVLAPRPSRYQLRGGVRKSRKQNTTREKQRHDSAIKVLERTLKVPIASAKKSLDLELVKSPKTRHPKLPLEQRALLVVDESTYELSSSYPVPRLASDNEVIIATHIVGLNPIDWKSVAYNFCLPAFPWITGRELSGTVVAIGSLVKDLSVGEKVWTSTYYKDVRAGCFQEYVTVPEHTVMPVPKNLSMEEASCLGVAGLTAAMTLWRWLGISFPQKSSVEGSKEWILIWGGSTITGQFATQLAALSGLNVITVTSAKMQALSKQLGAAHVVARDGKSGDEIVEEIRRVTNDKVTRAIDLVGAKNVPLAVKCCSTTLPVAIAPLAMMASGEVVPPNFTVHTVEMKQFILDSSCRVYADILNRLIGEGKVKVPALHVMDGGLKSIVGGLSRLRKGDMGGSKLVIRF